MQHFRVDFDSLQGDSSDFSAINSPHGPQTDDFKGQKKKIHIITRKLFLVFFWKITQHSETTMMWKLRLWFLVHEQQSRGMRRVSFVMILSWRFWRWFDGESWNLWVNWWIKRAGLDVDVQFKTKTCQITGWISKITTNINFSTSYAGYLMFQKLHTRTICGEFCLFFFCSLRKLKNSRSEWFEQRRKKERFRHTQREI